MKKLKSTIFIIALITLASAQHPDVGTEAFQFLNMNYDARSVAMGGASVAMPNDIYGVPHNPASVGYANRVQIMGGYRQIMMDIWGGPLGVAYPVSKTGIIIAPYLITLSSGEFEYIDENNLATGIRARSSYTAGGISAAKVFSGNVSAGATIKGMYHYLGYGSESYSADGYALDFGIQYRHKNNRVNYGVALRNVGFIRSGYLGEWNERELPYGIEGGISYIPRHIPNLLMAIDVNKFYGDYANFEPGFEYAILAKTLFVRGGYSFSSMDLEKALEVFRGERDDTYAKSASNTFSLGMGIASSMDDVDIKLDAAIQFNSGVVGPSVVVSLLVIF